MNWQIDFDITLKKLIGEMESLGGELIRQANELKRAPMCNLNSLGVVQGAGSSIDVKCGRLTLLAEVIKETARSGG